jgi:general secretion pathway protein D
MKFFSLSRLFTASLLVGALAACAPGQKFIDNGNELALRGDTDGQLAQLEAAVAAEPGNLAYREQLVRARADYVNRMLVQAEQLRNQARYDDAAVVYSKILGVDPNTPRATAALTELQVEKRHFDTVLHARDAFVAKQPTQAIALLNLVLREDPRNSQALKLKQDIEESDPQRDIPAALREGLKKQVSLEFRDANIKAVFEALSRSTGVNFVFDREVKPDLKVTVFLQKTSVEDAIGVLTVTNQLEKKYLNDNTVLIYPNTAVKQRDYQELMVKTFYLANADATKILAMLRGVLKTRDAYADEKLNSVTVRDTPAAIRLVEKTIQAQDLAEPEVTLDVEVLEVSRTRLTNLGVDPPSQFTLLNIVPSPTETVAADGSVVTNVNPVTTTSQLTVANLRHFNGGDIGIPNPQVKIRAELGNTNLLANPRIRVKNRDKAHILIGDKVPVITTTTTANVGVSESVSYLDVGLQLDVEPVVYLDNQVGIKIGLEVSSITREITSKAGTLTYQIGTRSATTELRLADGETQALAGLINDQERHSTAGIPGLADIPLVNRLFATTSDQHDKTEIVLLITPHVVRNIRYSPEVPMEFAAGTENTSGTAPLMLRAASSMSAPPLGDTSNPSGQILRGGGRGAPTRTREPESASDQAPAPEPAVPESVPPANTPGAAQAPPGPNNQAQPPTAGTNPKDASTPSLSVNQLPSADSVNPK